MQELPATCVGPHGFPCENWRDFPVGQFTDLHKKHIIGSFTEGREIRFPKPTVPTRVRGRLPCGSRTVARAGIILPISLLKGLLNTYGRTRRGINIFSRVSLIPTDERDVA